MPKPKPKLKQKQGRESIREILIRKKTQKREREKHTLYVRYGEIAANVRRRRWWFGPSATRFTDSRLVGASLYLFRRSPQNAQTRYSSLSLYIEDSNRGAVLFCPPTKKKTLTIITWNLKP